MDSVTTRLMELESLVREEGYFWPTYVEMDPVGTIQSPADILQSRKEEVMFGFPLPSEWLRKQRDTADSTIPLHHVQSDIQVWFPFIMNTLFPDWPQGLVKCTLAWTGSRNDPTRAKCFFLRVGRHESPPKDVLERMQEVLAEKFGIVEKPGWYRDALPEKRIVWGSY
ncbi:hypothetical protein EIP91_004741 [Steccherinum ochraceum]|uniref:Uncharacterized protein n=1 Tax=Steccherinum ochraceum TaxID=92696 RepID=A0A4R0R881_9APHY|nr:hypothetical protein EIP91_004741 [Steccherinum ochraceum]